MVSRQEGVGSQATRRLMRRFRAGDPSAVTELYALYGRSVFAVGYRALHDRGLAEETVQQTFLQAWRAAGRFDPRLDPGPWLYAIARRVAVDLHRRERRHDSEQRYEPEVAVLSPSFEGVWEAWQVRTALEKMPVDERAVLRSTYFVGLTHEETADRLGIPLGTVKSRSHRAHQRLAQLLSGMREETA
jgi:RNA polymerase sigma factor (sigma-70 family)